MANIPSLVDQVKNEDDMINLSQDDLLTYYTNTSSLAAESLSSVNGLGTEILFFGNAVRDSESTIVGIDVEILANTTSLSNLYVQQVRLEGESTLYNGQVISTMEQILLLDSTIEGSDLTLSSLNLEYLTLDAQIRSSTDGFIAEATRYSSLVNVYMNKAQEYATLEANIRDTSSLLEAAIITASDSYAVWLGAYSTLSGEQSTLTFLESEEIRLTNLQTLAIAEVNEAERILLSTSVSVDTHSSLYEVALLTRDYIQYLSSAQLAIESLAQAQENFTQAQAQYQANPTSGNLAILQDAETLLSNMQLKRAAYTQAGGARAPDYSTILGTVGTVAYETLIRGYNVQIAFEQSTIVNYTKLSNYALQYLEPLYRNQRDSSLSNESMYLNQSTFWGEKYVSSVIGYDYLVQQENLLTSQIYDTVNTIVDLDEEIEGSFDVRKRRVEGGYMDILTRAATSVQQGRAVDTREIVAPGITRRVFGYVNKGLQKEVDELTSSFVSYSTISSINTLLARESDELILQYNAQYDSVGTVIARLELQRDNTTSSIVGYQLESTITINQMNYLTVQMAKEDIEMFIAFNDIEKASFQYRESYIRGERVRYQNQYEGLVADAIREASNAALAAGQSNFMDRVNLDTPTVTNAYNIFTNLTTLLSEFDTLDTTYEERGTRLSNLRTEYTRYVTLTNELVTLLSDRARDPTNLQVNTNITTKRAEIAAKQTTVTTHSNDVNTATSQINTQKANVMTKFTSYFSQPMLAQIGTAISSFITAGYNTGYSLASIS